MKANKQWPFYNPPLSPPIVQTSVFRFQSIAELQAVADGVEPGHIYTRWGSPNCDLAQNALAALEGAEAGWVFGTGMAAIAAGMFSLCRPGDHIVAVGTLYGGTQMLCKEQLAQFGVETTFVGQDLDAVTRAIRPNTKVLFGETISNPKMELLDLEPLAKLAHQREIFFLVDNTFASPCLCRPLQWGAHGVMHSTTKYLNGHGDAMGGVLVGDAPWMEGVSVWAKQLGALLDPFAAWLLHRSLQTLQLRMDAHSRNAQQVAEFLEAHPKVAAVYYPSLTQPALAAKYLPQGSGGMISFVVDGDPDKAVQSFEHIVLAPSLADTSTTVSHPVSTSHRGLTEAEREAQGVPYAMIRLSVGIEPVETIVADLARGLEAV